MSDLIIVGGTLTTALIGYLIGGYLARTSDRQVGKRVPNDSLVAEAYQLADRHTNALQRSAHRAIVDESVRQIVDCEENNHVHAALEARRRLSEHVQRMKMGS